jgi:hypothetical protein
MLHTRSHFPVNLTCCHEYVAALHRNEEHAAAQVRKLHSDEETAVDMRRITCPLFINSLAREEERSAVEMRPHV